MVAMMGSLAAEKGWKRGPWTHEEDKLLSDYVSLHGDGRWSYVAKFSGLNRSGKSCRLRWVNYLRPGLKKSQLTPLEEGIIIELHAVLGNKWSTIAKYLPGRTDNAIKNYWRTHFNKREKPNHKKLELRRKAKELNQEQQLEQQPEEETKNETKSCEAQDNKQQDMGFVYPTMDHQHSFPLMHQELISSSWQDTTVDDGFWCRLWDFDEPQGFVDLVNQFNKYGMPNHITFGAGGDSKQNQDKTYSRFDDAYYNLC